MTAAVMNAYGYTQEDMYPLSPGRAVELFDTGHTIYLLNENNTEDVAFDRDEIITFGGDGLCGITHADWKGSPVYAAQMAVAANAEASRESELLYGDDDRFGIYQIKGGQDIREYIMEATSRHQETGIIVHRNNYELVYAAPLTEHIEFLSHRYQALFKLYQEFNTNKPADYTAQPISNGDVIVLKYGGDIASFYVDGNHFREIDGFLGDETQWATALARERERGVISFPAQAQNPSLTQTFSQLGKRLEEKSPQPPMGKPSLLGALKRNQQRAAQAGAEDATKTKEREGL
jgi:hypothetical protein